MSFPRSLSTDRTSRLGHGVTERAVGRVVIHDIGPLTPDVGPLVDRFGHGVTERAAGPAVATGLVSRTSKGPLGIRPDRPMPRTPGRSVSGSSVGPPGPDARWRVSLPASTARAFVHPVVPTRARRSGRSRTRHRREPRSRSDPDTCRGRGSSGARRAARGDPGGPGRGRRRSGHPRPAGGSPSSARSNFSLFSRSVACSPAYRRVRTPGAPPSASTSIPESSARVGRPLARAPKRALRAALASNVSPSSTGSPGIPSSSRETRSVWSSARSSRSSRSLWVDRVATSSRGRVTVER